MVDYSPLVATFGLFYLIIFSALSYSALADDYNQLVTEYYKLETYKMYEKKGQNEFGINGLYFHDKYYCVWVEGREQEEINKTVVHEQCHHLVQKKYEHFCQESKGS